MSNQLTAHKLNGRAKHLICQLFAEFESPTAILAAVETEFGVRVSRETLYHYKNHPRWQKVIDIVLNGSFHCALEAGKRMLKQGSGNIISLVASLPSSKPITSSLPLS